MVKQTPHNQSTSEMLRARVTNRNWLPVHPVTGGDAPLALLPPSLAGGDVPLALLPLSLTGGDSPLALLPSHHFTLFPIHHLYSTPASLHCCLVPSPH